MDILLYTIFGTAIGTLIASALSSAGGALLDRLNHRIVRRILSRLPEELPEHLRRRWREEIEADLETLSRQPLRGLWFALTLKRVGARRLAAELVLQIALSDRPMSAIGEKQPTSPQVQVVHNRWSLYEWELKERLGYEGLEERDEGGHRG
jgi:hypothetical protein